MKRPIGTLALLLAFGIISPMTYGQEDVYDDDGITDETYESEEYGIDDDWGYDSAEFSAFESDDIVEDDYGYYDSDFDWETDDEEWDAWWEGDTEAWSEDEDDDGFWDWW